MHNNYICFTNFPKTNELLCLFATIHIPEKVNTSLYNLIIKKCRQLIFENSAVLATPHLDQMYGIYIIVKESFYETGELQKYLSNHNLKAGAPTVVSKFIYEDCCMYTIIAKLAPKWNLVSNYFIRGRDFLTNTGTKHCVRLSLCINEKGETSLAFEISRVKLPAMSLDKLDLPDNYFKELNDKKIITFKLYDSKTIRVLPSLKRGNILSIALKINPSSTLQNYQQLRRHWKNTYGYRLPEIEKDIFYLEISFFDGSPVFTYPSVCVRPYEPTFVQRVEPGPVVTGFIADLMRSMSTVLGDTYPVPSHINQPLPRLFSASENLEHSIVGAIDLKTIPDSQSSAVVYLPTQKPQDNVQEPNTKLSQLLSLLNKPENKSTMYLTQKTQLSEKISQTPKTPKHENGTDKENTKSSLDLSKPVKKQSLISLELQKQAKFLSEKSKESSKLQENIEIKEASSSKNTVPVFVSKFPKIKKLKILPESIRKPTQKELKSLESNDDLSDFQTETKKINKPSIIKPLVKMNLKQQTNKENNNETPTMQNNNNNSERKRTLKNNTEGTVTKKQRAVATEINNMKEIVNNGTINKLNIQSLIKWLKKRNIHCTTKDTKSVLIEKVVNNLSKD